MQNACALAMGEERFRVFFATRDGRGLSHAGAFDLDVTTTPRVIGVADDPVLAPGPLGHFDDHGTLPSAAVRHDSNVYLYYVGWNPGKREPLFYASIGLAISTDGGRTFERHSPAPVMARGPHDPWMVSACCVLIDGGVFRMWYVSGLGWDERADGSLWSRYHVKYAESTDGIEWRRRGHVAFGLAEGETNIARPTIVKENSLYRAWFPVYSGAGYRIRYAESPDGCDWTRKDEENPLVPTPGSYDSDAVAYPWVIRGSGDRTFMLYNGNGLGRDGLALAERVP
ncbi:MAG TPA: hypothetical protein VHK90_07160 [Thermoanaerobaculia bacterium]|nr:hypothetical protein [Thermoanaerobaculia bacterium]